MDFPDRRQRMVDEQIAARGVRDPRVLDAMRDVPRHRFVADDAQWQAYEDRPLPIGEGQTISQPYMVAAMTELLSPQPSSVVLEIGTGSGYQTAVLARLAAHVTSIERHAPLADRAGRILEMLGYANVRVLVGDGTEGHAAGAPYDRILVTAGAPGVPDSLKRQLGEGGRLVIPVGPPGFQRLVLVERRGLAFDLTEGEGCVFVPLVGREGWPADGIGVRP
jgi:protein-L-isoaspartate(D-aspartate) O-methyltransferase